MGMVDQQNAFLYDVNKLLVRIWEQGWKVTGGELYRTAEQQAIYMKEGKSKTSNSNHLRRLAIDLNLFDTQGNLCLVKTELQWLGDYWEGLTPGRNRWGGNYKTFLDCPHFERIPE